MSPRTIVIAGDAAGSHAPQTAEQNGWPLLAEPTSGATNSPNQISAYRYLLPLLANDKATQTKPNNIVVFGRPTLNRAVNQLITNPPQPSRFNIELNSNFLELWLAASKIAHEVLTQITQNELDNLFGPLAAARQIWQAGGQLVIGASNPIRDIDIITSLAPSPSRVFSNRGVAGIDGTIATALGIATASGSHTASGNNHITRLYLGDLTFLHDASSLLSGYGETRPQLQIIVANDGGGSIFSGLEHGEWAEQNENRRHAFKRVFTTPQSASIEQLSAGYGVQYTKVSRLADLQAALASPNPHVEVIEVGLNGKNRRLMQQSLAELLAESLVRAGVL